MFPLNHGSRRIWCRTLFVAGCLLPTVAVVVCAVWRQLPVHLRAAESELSEQLGLPVRISGVTHPRPRVAVYRGLEVYDPETGGPLCRARLLEIDSSGAEVVIDASQLEIEAAGQRRLWRLLQRLLQESVAERDVLLLAGEVTLHGEPQGWTLTDVQGGLGWSESGAAARLQFRVAAFDMPRPAVVQVSRDRTRDTAATVVSLQTGPAPLPCSLLSTVWPEIERLGRAAGFSGSIHVQDSLDSWQGMLGGEFHELDLYSLVTAYYPHRLNGPARMHVDDARFDNGRLQSASGVLTAGPGVVSRSLLDAAAASLGALAPSHASAAESLVLYEQLSVGFDIDEAGLRLSGQCGTTDSGRIMVNRGGVLLADPPRQPLPVVALVRTLVPENAVQVPATRETEPLVSWLPVPHIRRPRPSATGQSPPGGRLLRLPR